MADWMWRNMATIILFSMLAGAWWQSMTTYTAEKGYTRTQRYLRTFAWMLFVAILWGAGMQHD